MQRTERIQDALNEGDYPTVEEEWISLVSENPTEIDFFVRIADALEKRDQGERAQPLLQLLDEQLVEKGDFESRLRLIRSAGKRFIGGGRVHETVIDSLEKLFADRHEQLDILLPTVGLDKSKDETPKLWDKVERLRSLLAYEKGTVVEMKGKGVGEVIDVNLQLQTLKVDFETIKGMSVGFRAAGKMLTVLDTEHVLYRKHTTPDELESMKPAELLQAVLQSYEGPMTGAEVKTVVAGVVPKQKWTSWWNAARKHPQVLSSGGSRATYTWAESSDAAEDVVWQAFVEAETRDKIDHFKRSGNQDPELRARMATTLDEIALSLADSNPSLAFEIHETIIRQNEPSQLKPSELIKSLKDIGAFLAGIESRQFREAAYGLVCNCRDDWDTVLQERFLKETEGRALQAIAKTFQDDPIRQEDLLDQALSQPAKTPAAFVWAAQEAPEHEGYFARRSLRLLRQALLALNNDAFAPHKKALENMFESGGLAPKVLAVLTSDEAVDAEKAIQEAAGLADYQRDPLLESLYLKHPTLKDGDRDAHILYATAESLEEKQNQLREIAEQEIPANRIAIEEARAMGDLRENFEYKSARQRHEYLTARATALNNEINRSSVLDPGAIDTSEIRIGTKVDLSGADGSSRTLTILGPWESSPEDDIVSYESELAQSILGKRDGDQIEVEGANYRVESISVWTD
ncbi:MAG: GreA/GreB family elongation factor [Acidobacteriota bacterium]